MLQLTYISTATPSLMIGDVEKILETSRRRNGADRITGLLVFDGKRFLQALEGEAPAVERAYARIRQDGRHRAVVQLSERQVEEREFGAWAMASHIIGPVVGDGDMVAMVDALTATIPDANTRALFRSFSRVRGAA
jgi:hypothetical protein